MHHVVYMCSGYSLWWDFIREAGIVNGVGSTSSVHCLAVVNWIIRGGRAALLASLGHQSAAVTHWRGVTLNGSLNGGLH